MEDAKHYPPGTVRSLLTTDAVTPATRQALEKRLTHTFTAPQFFTPAEAALLRQVCDRLVPQPDPARPIDVVGPIDQRLAAKVTNGWRYDALPADQDAYRMGLRGIDESAQLLYGGDFQNLSGEQQDMILTAVQEAGAPGPIWEQLPAERFFEELLAEVVEVFYSHPLAQEEIGYVGMADAPGWQRIGLNEREEREPTLA